MKELLTVDDLQRILSVSGDWVRERVRRGEIRKVSNMGRLVRFHPDEIQRIFGAESSRSLKIENKKTSHRKEFLWQP